jgi:hypothetical protein
MAMLELSDEEVEVLRDVVAHVIGEMNIEVFRTDTYGFKQMLKHRREVLEKVLCRLETAPAH